jgi:hypothetical protein
MKDRIGRNRLATITGLVALTASVGAFTPGTAVASGLQKCATKTVTLELENGVGQPKVKFKEMFTNISTSGVTCASAGKFFTLLANDKTSAPPEHFKCKIGHFKVALGHFPEVCTKPGARIQYGQQGG